MKPTLVGGSEVIRTLLLVSCAMTTAGVAGPSLCYGTPVVTSGIASLQLSVFGPEIGRAHV
mgnify:CR=1 FL=1